MLFGTKQLFIQISHATGMNKRPLQDIVKKNPRSRRPSISMSQPTSREVPTREIPPRPRPEKTRGARPLSNNLATSGLLGREGSKKKKGLFLAVGSIAAGILLIAFFLSMIFSGATVTVFPKQQNDIFIDGSFIARKEPQTGELGYTTLTLDRTQTIAVDSTKQEDVQEYAVGEIIVFNEFDQNPQRLIKNTRFESPDGKIYRIRESVTVPGMTVGSGGQLEPGKLEVTVYADEPGDEYNVEQAQFTIPGFEGTPRFSKFYARSKTSIGGGYDGIRLVLDEKVEQSAREQLREQLIEELKEAVFNSSEKPEEFHLYENAVFIDFEALPTTESEDKQVEIREKGIIQAILF